jgi:hypothetical protein
MSSLINVIEEDFVKSRILLAVLAIVSCGHSSVGEVAGPPLSASSSLHTEDERDGVHSLTYGFPAGRELFSITSELVRKA